MNKTKIKQLLAELKEAYEHSVFDYEFSGGNMKMYFSSIDDLFIYELEICVQYEHIKIDNDLMNNICGISFAKKGDEKLIGGNIIMNLGRESILWDYADGFECVKNFYDSFKLFLDKKQILQSKHILYKKEVESQEQNLKLTGIDRISSKNGKKYQLSLDLINFENSICLGEMCDDIPSTYFYSAIEEAELFVDEFTPIFEVLMKIKEECDS